MALAAYSDLVLHYLPNVVHAFRSTYPDVRIRLLARFNTIPDLE